MLIRGAGVVIAMGLVLSAQPLVWTFKSPSYTMKVWKVGRPKLVDNAVYFDKRMINLGMNWKEDKVTKWIVTIEHRKACAYNAATVALKTGGVVGVKFYQRKQGKYQFGYQSEKEPYYATISCLNGPVEFMK